MLGSSGSTTQYAEQSLIVPHFLAGCHEIESSPRGSGRPKLSTGEAWHRGGMASKWSIASEDSVLSIASTGSVLSIGSIGSALSIGSVGSIASAFSIGSAASAGSVMSAASAGSLMSAASAGEIHAAANSSGGRRALIQSLAFGAATGLILLAVRRRPVAG